jgi:hypothetical protein
VFELQQAASQPRTRHIIAVLCPHVKHPDHTMITHGCIRQKRKRAHGPTRVVPLSRCRGGSTQTKKIIGSRVHASSPHLHGVLPARRRASGGHCHVCFVRGPTDCSISRTRARSWSWLELSAEPTIYPSHSEYRSRHVQKFDYLLVLSVTCESAKIWRRVDADVVVGSTRSGTSSAYNCRPA